MSSLQDVNPRVKEIRVSSHTHLQTLAAEITQRILEQGAQNPLKQVHDVSSGDLHRAGMKPISFVRQVLSACLYPQLLEDNTLPLDVRRRAQKLLAVCEAGSVGCYTASSGLLYIKQSIAEFIMRRDGVQSHATDVLITSGSQRALTVVVRLIADVEGAPQTGVLTPMPCPHTLPALLDDAGATLVPFQLLEERGWAVDVDELHRALKAARRRCNPRAVFISNPGDPTGHVQDRRSIQEVIEFAAAERLLLLVDEVYQDCVIAPGREFVSYRKVLSEMGSEFSESVELVSFHSLSSACTAECGLRAGYAELLNIDPGVKRHIDMFLDTDICTAVPGQLALELMVNPPSPGEASYHFYKQEIHATLTTLSQNARWAQEFLDDLPGMSCQPAMGGIFLYPRLCLTTEIMQQAEVSQVAADVLYCQRLLEEEGVLVGAGSQNGATAGKHHLRICVLVPPDVLREVLARLASFQRQLMEKTSPGP